MPGLDEEYTIQVFGCMEEQTFPSWITLCTVKTFKELEEKLETLEYRIIAQHGALRVLDGRGHVIKDAKRYWDANEIHGDVEEGPGLFD